MIALLQRVAEASVVVNGNSPQARVTGAIGRGILAFIAVEKGDTESQSDRLLQRILNYRIFDDGDGRMNLNLRQAGGQLLLVSQFTLAANTNTGNRPSFTQAAEPADGRRLFDYLLEEVLNNQSKEAQNFLLKTSVLKQLHGDLCREMLTGLFLWLTPLRCAERQIFFL